MPKMITYTLTEANCGANSSKPDKLKLVAAAAVLAAKKLKLIAAAAVLAARAPKTTKTT